MNSIEEEIVSPIRSKVVFLYFEFLGLGFALGLYAAFLKFILNDLLGLKDLLSILLYWALYGVGAGAFAFCIRKIKGGWSLKDLGFRLYRSWKKDLWYGLVIASLMYVVTIPLEVILLPSVTQLAADSMGDFLQMPLLLLIPAAGLLSLVFGFITGAFHEEIWYRGYLQGLFSREAAPAAGFWFSLIVFSLGHYFSHPEWSLLNVLNTIPHAFFFCLAYFATGSLVVSMVVHTFANFAIPTFAIPFYAKGYRLASYISIFVLWLVLLAVCYFGKKELLELKEKAKVLFYKSQWGMGLLGIFLAALSLFIDWGEGVFKRQLPRTAHLVGIAVLAAVGIGLSFLKKERSK